MERINTSVPETDAAWSTHKGCRINGHDAQNNPIFGTPGQPNDGALPPLPAQPLLISEFLYDGAEFVEICNPSLTAQVDLSCYKVGDEETSGGNESMYRLPISKTLEVNSCLVVAKDANEFIARFNRWPEYDLTSNNTITDLIKYPVWANGSWSLANDGDEIVILGPNNEILDSVAYRNGDYTTLGLEPDASAPAPSSLQRVWPTDTNSMPNDFVRTDPNPGNPTLPPPPPAAPPPAVLPEGMYAYWGDLHSHTTYSDGVGPPYYALAIARAAGLHFYAITDHDWWLTPIEWAKILTQTTNATVPGQFIALRGVEWTHDSVGHINIFNTNTLLNSRTNPMFSTLPDLYSWLAANPDVIAEFNHPDPSYGGTFYNFAYHPAAAQVMFMQEIGNKAQKYTTYEPSFVQSNSIGWRTAPTNNGDTHNARWGTDSTARTGIVAPALTESDLLAAMRARRVFATEDSNLAAALRLNGAWMGSSLTATGPLPLIVDMVDPDPESLTLFLYDGNLPLATVPLATSTGQWTATVEALPGHFFWVKVVQADGNAAYTAPVWIEGQATPDTLVLNEILPAPRDWDWDGNGSADYQDEWIEVYNPTNRPIGLGGWQLVDGSSGATYNIPLGAAIPAQGFAVFYHASILFSLNNDEETVSLIHPNGAVADTFNYGHSPGYDESYCRLPDGGAAWSDNCGPSPNAANWEKAPAGPLTVKIYDAKRLTYNAWVRVKGHVTARPGILGVRTMYIQDNTSGILIYLPKDYGQSFDLGDRVEVVGNLRAFHDEFEIVVRQRSDVKFLEHGSPLPPLPIATTSLLEPYEGMLVMLQGQAVDFKGRTTIWLDDGTGRAKTYIRTSHRFSVAEASYASASVRSQIQRSRGILCLCERHRDAALR
ncbi:MAG: lamin tail domain-containing protein [Chloroflexi bacterium]|nr:lamin tail domain-containing protein [Chloroflexota bacterium]